MLIKQLGWKKIEEMIQYQSRVMVYKSVKGLLHNTSKIHLFEILKIFPTSFVALLLIFIFQNEIQPMVKKASRSLKGNCN